MESSTPVSIAEAVKACIEQRLDEGSRTYKRELRKTINAVQPDFGPVTIEGPYILTDGMATLYVHALGVPSKKIELSGGWKPNNW